ncbi:MAG: hypothetical protein ACRYE9_04115 [Janthinobacterium lividum]
MVQILLNRSIIEFKGSGSLKFLQNQTTNNLVKYDYCYTYMLSNLGKYLFDFFCYKISDNHLIVDISSDQAQGLIQKLNFYNLRAGIEIRLSDKYIVTYSRQESYNQFNDKSIKCIRSYPDPRWKLLGFRSLISSKYAHNVSSSHHDVALEDKYEHAIPDGADLIYDKSIPLEYGAEELNCIDFHKGCYIGQEVMSRTKYQGVIRKKIFKMTSNDDLSCISKGAAIKIEGDNIIGINCSSYKSKAIVLIREEKYQNDLSGVTVDGIDVELEIPKWR